MHGGSGGEAVINGCRIQLRPCDSCKAAAADLFCLDDSAFLCFGCDDGIHGANRLPELRHGRVWLCDVCEDAPAAVTCEADAASLCASCDFDIHSANTIASRRLRHHVEPSFGYSAQCVGECVSSFPQHVGVVPENGTTMTTNCEPNMSYASLGSVNASTADPSNTTVTSAPLVTPFCGVNRKARVLRYKEKRKNREFKKTIRYTSRKAYAEMRPRVKGRFAKRTTKSEQELVNNVFGTSTAVIGNNDFGVVPT